MEIATPVFVHSNLSESGEILLHVHIIYVHVQRRAKDQRTSVFILHCLLPARKCGGGERSHFHLSHFKIKYMHHCELYRLAHVDAGQLCIIVYKCATLLHPPPFHPHPLHFTSSRGPAQYNIGSAQARQMHQPVNIDR